MNGENRPAEPATPPQQTQIRVDASNLKTTYANLAAISANVSEFYLTFGLNTDPYSQSPAEPVRFESRIIMTPDAAKRLCLNLTATLQAYEQRFGIVELDLQKRIRS